VALPSVLLGAVLFVTLVGSVTLVVTFVVMLVLIFVVMFVVVLMLTFVVVFMLTFVLTFVVTFVLMFVVVFGITGGQLFCATMLSVPVPLTWPSVAVHATV
jgi:hypothetical protein